MEEKAIIEQFKSMPWKPWLHRRFDPFVTYLMMVHFTREAYEKEGIHGNFPIALYDTDDWYGCDEMFLLAEQQAEKYLQEKDIFVLTKQCEDAFVEGRKQIAYICKNQTDPIEDFKKALESISPINVYLGVAHSSEPYYYKKIRTVAERLVSGDEVEKFIGDISFPSKKNALANMEEDIRAGVDAHTLYEKYAWMNARGGFRPGYTVEEIKDIQEKTLQEPVKQFHHPLNIPSEILPFVKQVQELVYLRTLRTDALYELYHLAQPIFQNVANELNIESVKDYLPEDIINGNLKKIPHEYAIIKYDDGVIVTDPIIKSEKMESLTQVQGVIAEKGIVQGCVKLVFTPAEAHKVQPGDILVTNMTTPAYLQAMHKAAGFVTDEGGITCHAAILAREMRKPCVIGTKFATKVFKDGDMVEVDASKGIVRKI